MAVLLMGWSWAVYLAQTCLEELLGDVLGPDRQLINGAPIPPLSFKPSEQFLTYFYIDDFGVMGMKDPSDLDGPSAKKLRDQMKEILRKVGLGCHKEEDGLKADAIGVSIGGSPPRATPLLFPLWLLIFATNELLNLSLVTLNLVETIVGGWTWRMLLARGSLSVFHEIYKWMHTVSRDTLLVLPPKVRRELAAARNLAPLYSADLSAGWHPIFFMTDASPTGGAVCCTDAKSDELRKEAVWAARTAFIVSRTPSEWMELEPVETSASMAAAVSQLIEELGSHQEQIPRGPNPKVRVLRFLHLFSGPRREEDLEFWLVALAAAKGIVMIVDVADLETYPPVDVLDETTERELVARAKAKYWDGAHAGPPCATWAIVLWFEIPGFSPSPYRSRDCPWGMPGLKGKRLARCEAGTVMLFVTLEVLEALGLCNSSVTLEFPRDPGEEPYPSIWPTKPVLDFEMAIKAERAELDQCMTGADSKKPTTITGNPPPFKGKSKSNL